MLYINQGMINFRCARCGEIIEIDDSYFREDGLGYCTGCEKSVEDDKILSLMRELAKITDEEVPGEGTQILQDFEQKWGEYYDKKLHTR